MHHILLSLVLSAGTVSQSFSPDGILPALAAFAASLDETAGSPAVEGPETGAESTLPVYEATVEENASAGTLVCRILSDQERNCSCQISGGIDADVFAVDSVTGEITVVNPQFLDAEASPELRAEITIHRAEFDHDPLLRDFVSSLLESGVRPEDLVPTLGTRETVELRVQVLDLPEMPIIAEQQFSVPEHSFAGTEVGHVAAWDDDRNDRLTWSIESAVPAGGIEIFEIDAATGTISTRSSAMLDFEQCESWMLNVKVMDQSGQSSEAQVAIDVTNINDQPVLEPAELQMTSVDAAGTLIGRIAATDADCDDAIQYRLINDPTGGAFVLDPLSGDLKLADPSRLAAFPGQICRLHVEAVDRGGLRSAARIVVALPFQNTPGPVLTADTPTNAESPGADVPADGQPEPADPANAGAPVASADAGGSSESAQAGLPVLHALLLLGGIITFCVCLPIWLIYRRMHSGEEPGALEETADSESDAAATDFEKSIEQLIALTNEQERISQEQECRLLTEIEQLRLEIRQVREQAATDASALEQQIQDKAAEVLKLQQELAVRESQAQNTSATAEAAGDVGNFEQRIHELQLQVEERDQLVATLKSNLETLMASPMFSRESERGLGDSSSYGSRDTSWRSDDETDPMYAAYENSNDDDAHSDLPQTDDRAEETATTDFQDHDRVDFLTEVRASFGQSDNGSRDDRAVGDHQQLLEARHRMEQARDDLQQMLPSWYVDSGPALKPAEPHTQPFAEEPANETAVETASEATSGPDEATSGPDMAVNSLRAELAGLFDLKRRGGRLETTAEDSTRDTTPVVADTLPMTPEPSLDDSENGADEDHDDYVRKYMSRLLNRQDTVPAEMSGTTAPAGRPTPSASAEGRAALDRRQGDRRSGEAERRRSDSQADCSAAPRQRIDVESLRHKTNSFREIAVHSVESALATHTLRKARSGLTVRILLLAALIGSTMVVATANVLQVTQLPALTLLLGALTVVSVGELILRLRSLYSGNRKAGQPVAGPVTQTRQTDGAAGVAKSSADRRGGPGTDRRSS